MTPNLVLLSQIQSSGGTIEPRPDGGVDLRGIDLGSAPAQEVLSRPEEANVALNEPRLRKATALRLAEWDRGVTLAADSDIDKWSDKFAEMLSSYEKALDRLAARDAASKAATA